MIKKFFILFLLTGVVLSAQEVSPISGKIEFKKGKIGKGGYFDGKSYIQYPIEYLKANAGTLEMWIKTEKSLDEINFQPILSAGANNPFWFLVCLNKNGVVFMYKNGRPPYKKEGEFYASVKANITEWNKDKWHHLAFIWGNTGKGKSFIQIYVDGKLKEARYNLTIGQDWPENLKFFGLGYNTASTKGEKFQGLIDEVRISNRPATKGEIKKSYEKVEKGEAIEADESTLLLLNFDDDMKGISKTKEKINQKEIDKIFSEIIKEIM